MRERRLALGLSQEDVAAKAGISDRTLKRMEAGRPCRPATVRAVEEALIRESGPRLGLPCIGALKSPLILSRMTRSGFEFGYRAESCTLSTGRKAWRVVTIQFDDWAFGRDMKPILMANGNERAWALEPLEALAILGFLEVQGQADERLCGAEWGHPGTHIPLFHVRLAPAADPAYGHGNAGAP